MKKLVKFRAPSNIAFVKYWGKYGRQFPVNPSFSMTLDKCHTETEIEFSEKCHEGASIDFYFENAKNPHFESRIKKFLKSIDDITPSLSNFDLKINSKNSFPHSAGIASSASAMAALAGCIVTIEEFSNQSKFSTEEFINRASYIARLGSGSACRSICGPYQVWGTNDLENGLNEYASSFNTVHKEFEVLYDSILIISKDKKSVSSSQGHRLMNSHFFKEARIEQANENFRNICSAIKTGDFENFGEVLENEALTLHALMMSSYPSFILLEPNSIEIIKKIKSYRNETHLPVYFTIDAGPNIHLIYPEKVSGKIHEFINQELKPLFKDVIHDQIGLGLKRLDE